MRQFHSTDENQKVDASTQTENSVAEHSDDNPLEEKGLGLQEEENTQKGVVEIEAFLKSNEWSIWYKIHG